MSDELVKAYRTLINRHYTAVQTDTLLEHTDNWKLEKKSKQFWQEFYALEIAFIESLKGVKDEAD